VLEMISHEAMDPTGVAPGDEVVDNVSHAVREERIVQR
jgi:hypothetical protein